MSETKKTFKHLTLNERAQILSMLENHYSYRQIAKRLNRSPSTIAREVQLHSIKQIPAKLPCKNFSGCDHRLLCKGCSSSHRQHCASCNLCTKNCPDYEPLECPRLQNTTYVCNGCLKLKQCNYVKRFYDPAKAEESYLETLRESRNGFNLTEEEITRIDELVFPLIRKGQSPYHILKIYKGEIPCSEATLRRLVDSGCMMTKNIDLRNVVKRKARKKIDHAHIATIKRNKIGHLWDDYVKHTDLHPGTGVVEMDCVKGIQSDSSVLLTLHFTKYHLQLAYILDAHTSQNVVRILDILESTLGAELFQTMFPLILTDNGSEFAEREVLERSIYGGTRTTVYYCQPFRSDQKGACERNHEFIRYCLPKRTSIDFLFQTDVNLMMNHINSYARKSLEGHTPYEYARFMNVPEDFFALLGLEEIPAKEINLTPSLFKR